MLERIEDEKEYLVGCSVEDINKHRGYILALRDMMNLDFTEDYLNGN